MPRAPAIGAEAKAAQIRKYMSRCAEYDITAKLKHKREAGTLLVVRSPLFLRGFTFAAILIRPPLP